MAKNNTIGGVFSKTLATIYSSVNTVHHLVSVAERGAEAADLTSEIWAKDKVAELKADAAASKLKRKERMAKRQAKLLEQQEVVSDQ